MSDKILRRSLWALAFAPMAAQEKKPDDAESMKKLPQDLERLLETMTRLIIQHKEHIDKLEGEIEVLLETMADAYVEQRRKRLNNECPVCGTVAEPIKNPERCCPATARACYPEDQACVSTRVTRCANCNAAFWQDEQ